MQIGLNCNKKMLSEIDQIISDEITITDTMNKHFVNITKNQNLVQHKLKQKSLHCQKYWIDTKATKTKVLLISDLK